MIKNSLIVASLIFLVFSCKKETLTISIPHVHNSSFAIDTMLPLAVGNYWIYQKSDDDTLGGLHLQNSFDSVYVEKDTLIAGQQYFKVLHTNSNFYYYYFLPNFNGAVYIKDSADFLVTSTHAILLDKMHLHDTIRRDSISNIEYICLVPDNFSQKQFVIGNYSGLSMNSLFIRNHPQSMIFDTVCAQMFVDGIGIVKSVYSFIGCNKHCRYSQNLIRYHCN